MKAPRRGLRLAKFQLLLFLLVGFLLPDVLADHLFRQTDGADTVPTRPEVVAREVPLSTKILPVNPDRRLPFQEPDGVRYADLRRNAQENMHVVGEFMIGDRRIFLCEPLQRSNLCASHRQRRWLTS